MELKPWPLELFLDFEENFFHVFTLSTQQYIDRSHGGKIWAIKRSVLIELLIDAFWLDGIYNDFSDSSILFRVRWCHGMTRANFKVVPQIFCAKKYCLSILAIVYFERTYNGKSYYLDRLDFMERKTKISCAYLLH